MNAQNINADKLCATVKEYASESLLDTNTQTQTGWIKNHLSNCSDCRREVYLLHLIEKDILELSANEHSLCTKHEMKIRNHSRRNRRHVSQLNNKKQVKYMVAACLLLLSCLALDKIQPNITSNHIHTSKNTEDTQKSVMPDRSGKQAHNMNIEHFNKETNLREKTDLIITTNRAELRTSSERLTRIAKNTTRNTQKTRILTHGDSVEKKSNPKKFGFIGPNHSEVANNHSSSVSQLVATCNSSIGIFGRRVHA